MARELGGAWERARAGKVWCVLGSPCSRQPPSPTSSLDSLGSSAWGANARFHLLLPSLLLRFQESPLAPGPFTGGRRTIAGLLL